MWAFLAGLVIGYAGGFVVGALTADPNSSWQNRVREAVSYVLEEAQKAAAEEEQHLKAEFQRLTGVSPEELSAG